MNDRRKNNGQSAAKHIRLDATPLSISALSETLGHSIRVEVADTVWDRIDASRKIVDRIAAGDEAVYGINTGFGNLCRQRIDRDDLGTLQHNLIRSHAVGVGASVPDEIVRWMLLLKIHALGFGFSGVRRETVNCLTEMLNHDILPVVPTQGSLGASGDLAPLAHMVLPLIGEGHVQYAGQTKPSAEAFADCKIETIQLAAKEGLALINGTQFMCAYAAAILVRSLRAAKHADITASMSLEALCGSAKPFAAKLHELRPHPGAIAVAENFRALLRDSEINASHAGCDKVQDPYSLRCIPQVHGASRDAICHAMQTVECEINSVTDNPVIFPDGTTISGGNFHGQPLALTLDYLAIALSEFASISERRIYFLLSGHDGLPPQLTDNPGLNSGFMIAQYTAAALVSENKILASPASVDTIPTSMGQEDHVSMGATSATKAWRITDHLETVLAIEQLCAAQALDYRLPLKPGAGPRAAHQIVRESISHADQDRLFGQDIEMSLTLLRSHIALNSVENTTGPLK